MRFARRTTALGLILFSLSQVVGAQDASSRADTDESTSPSYLRIKRGKEGEPVALQTAVVRFAGQGQNSPVTVDLIAAVHVGDSGYYARLNELFASYQAVLYELIAPEGTRIPRGGQGSSFHPVSALQKAMKSILELQFQLESIDYTKSNLVHADMSPAEFAQSMRDRKESFIQMFFRMMGQAMAEQSKSKESGLSDVRLLMALFAQDRPLQLKRIMAEQFQDLERVMIGLNGPDGSTIITERNKKALRKLDEQLNKGQTKIAIFYGAGHMADIERRLASQYGMKRVETSWINAWNLVKHDGDDLNGSRS